MKIGITFDLRREYLDRGYGLEETAEFDRESTIEAIEGALASLRHEPERIGSADGLVRALAVGKRWDMVFNIAEGLGGYGREGCVPSLLEYYGIPYVFSDPLTMGLTLHKGMAKIVARSAGVATPDFLVVESLEDLDSFDLPFPVFAKPVAEGTGKGVTSACVIRDRAQLAPACRDLLKRYAQPVLVETYLPGREFTVGVVGTGDRARSVGTMEIVLKGDADRDVYTYDNKERCEERVEYVLSRGPEAEEAEALALAAYRCLGVRDAGRVDVRQDAAGRMAFMEVNPLAGLHPEHSDLPIICTLAGIGYVDLMDMILASAMRRCGSVPRPVPAN